MKLTPGSIFARDFRVVSPVAEGGMGAVYAVEQLSTGKRRALKVMQPQLIPDARARERFVLEARIGSQIESEHVVDVVASGIDEPTGMPWIAMELLEGVDLAEHVRQRDHLSPQETYEVLSQLCDGLGAAHARGIVHRDLKPENVFISASKRRGVPFLVKILDFGIAKVTHENQTSATGTSAMGSPLWMAPEQTESGTRLRPATDVWAVGLMAFWMLTGRSYWRAGNQAEIALTPIFTELLVLPLDPPSVRAAQLGLAHLVPPSFDAWFFRCVARSHEHRFVDATQAITSLSPHFTLVEASSARRMIPSTVAMPSVPPSALGTAPTMASAAVTTPMPRTSAHPAIAPPSVPHYVPQDTERSAGLVPPAFVGGAMSPGVATAPGHPAHAHVAQGHIPQGHIPQGHIPQGHIPQGHIPQGHIPQGHIPQGHIPQGHIPQGHIPQGHISQAPIPVGQSGPAGGYGQYAQGYPGLGPLGQSAPLAQAIATAPMTPALHTPMPIAPPAPASRGRSDGTVRWGVIGALAAAFVLALVVAAGLAALVLWPSAPPPPRAIAERPDAALPEDAGQDAWEPVDAGTDAPAPRARSFASGGSDPPTTSVAVAAPEAGPFPDGSDRRFVGGWSGEGWRYRLMIDLARDGRAIQGAFRWTLAETPDAMYTARVGETATEYVRGSITPGGQLSMDGTSVTDDSLISADHYELELASDGTLTGTAREGGGRLNARMIE